MHPPDRKTDLAAAADDRMDAETRMDDDTGDGLTSDVAEGGAHVPSGAAGPDLVMPDDQGDGADDTHTDRDGPSDAANHGKGPR